MTEPCTHEHIDWERGDPSVGIFGDYVWCRLCGAVAEEFTERYEGGFLAADVTKWGEPEEGFTP